MREMLIMEMSNGQVWVMKKSKGWMRMMEKGERQKSLYWSMDFQWFNGKLQQSSHQLHMLASIPAWNF